MPYALVVLLTLPLAGCIFVWRAPAAGSDPGNTCLEANAYVGQRIKQIDKNQIGTVKALHGRSSRCQEASHPILGEVEYGE